MTRLWKNVKGIMPSTKQSNRGFLIGKNKELLASQNLSNTEALKLYKFHPD